MTQSRPISLYPEFQVNRSGVPDRWIWVVSTDGDVPVIVNSLEEGKALLLEETTKFARREKLPTPRATDFAARFADMVEAEKAALKAELDRQDEERSRQPFYKNLKPGERAPMVVGLIPPPSATVIAGQLMIWLESMPGGHRGLDLIPSMESRKGYCAVRIGDVVVWDNEEESGHDEGDECSFEKAQRHVIKVVRDQISAWMCFIRPEWAG